MTLQQIYAQISAHGYPYLAAELCAAHVAYWDDAALVIVYCVADPAHVLDVEALAAREMAESAARGEEIEIVVVVGGAL